MSSTRYLEIIALQSPISIGNDVNDRAMLSFNVLSKHVGSPVAFGKEICKLIQNASLATLGTDMFYGSKSQLPTTAGPFISVSPTGGLSPEQTHNGDKLSRPSAQIIVRAVSWTIAEDKANAIHALLDGQHNVTVTT